MARPSKFDRKEAVELAMNEIWHDGYGANSVKALSEKLGITRSSFYHAFGSREDLFLEVLELYASQTPDNGLDDTTPGKSIRKILTDTVRTVCKVRASDPEHRGCLGCKSVAELCGTHEEFGSSLEHLILTRSARIETLLKRGVEQNEIKGDVDTYALAQSLHSYLIGLNVMSQVVRDEQELWNGAKAMLKGLGLFNEGKSHENI